MTIKCLFGQRKCSYEGQYGPEVLVAWDEFSLEENSEGFEQECEKARKTLESEFSAFRVIDISVPTQAILNYLNEAPKVKGVVVSAA